MTSKFKELLIELDGLMKYAKGSLFRRAQIVVALIKDDDYWEYLKTRNLDDVCRQLQRYLSDAKFSLDDLQVMLDFAPDASQWTEGNLGKLCADAWESRRSARQKTMAESREFVRSNLAQDERTFEIAERPKAAVHESPPLESPLVQRLRKKIAELIAENKLLRQQNNALRKRIQKQAVA